VKILSRQLILFIQYYKIIFDGITEIDVLYNHNAVHAGTQDPTEMKLTAASAGVEHNIDMASEDECIDVLSNINFVVRKVGLKKFNKLVSILIHRHLQVK